MRMRGLFPSHLRLSWVQMGTTSAASGRSQPVLATALVLDPAVSCCGFSHPGVAYHTTSGTYRQRPISIAICGSITDCPRCNRALAQRHVRSSTSPTAPPSGDMVAALASAIAPRLAPVHPASHHRRNRGARHAEGRCIHSAIPHTAQFVHILYAPIM